ncbi:hypothetical protein [Streptosporangium sp. KLBMP 9127]|nr:hypothetical protein [Streptosporangium sp. KLBMP 9127]
MSFHPLFADLPPGASAQAAGRTLGYGGPPARAAGARSGDLRLRCASLLKPLYGWAAAHCHGPYAADPAKWRADAEPAVLRSDNPATLRLWWSAGPQAILGTLRERTGVTWQVSGADPTWFGGVEAAADEVVTAYGALALAAAGGDPAAEATLSWMRQAEHTFAIAETVAAGLGRAAAEVGVKCGWYGRPDEAGLRTHAVAVAPSGDGIAVVAALTAMPYPDEGERAAYRSMVAGGEPVVGEHERLAGELLRGLIATTVAELGGAAARERRATAR